MKRITNFKTGVLGLLILVAVSSCSTKSDLESSALFGLTNDGNISFVFRSTNGTGDTNAGTPVIQNRLNGTAPLAVLFDATGSLSGEGPVSPGPDAEYAWNFGDPGSGTWDLNQNLKNEDTGIIAAHLFETPGKFSVTLNISDQAGVTSQNFSVTVDDPETVYGAGRTYCLSRAGDFSGCPADGIPITLTMHGAARIRGLLDQGNFRGAESSTARFWNEYAEKADGVDHNAAMEYESYATGWDCGAAATTRQSEFIDVDQITALLQPGARLLFRRGEKYTFFNNLQLDNFAGGHLGAYGTCENPDGRGICANNPRFGLVAYRKRTDLLILKSGLEDIRISDLTLDQVCGDENRGINAHGTVQNLTMNRLKISRFSTGVIGRSYGQMAPHASIALFNSILEKMGSGAQDDAYDATACVQPRSPVWHTGDHQTPLPRATWDNVWSDYKTEVLAILSSPACKGGGNVMYFPARGHMLMGNILRDARTRRAEHVLRLPFANRSLIAHNLIAEPSPDKHALKLHHMGDCRITADCAVNPVQNPDLFPTEFVVVRENRFEADSDIAVTIGPGTSKIGELVHRVYFESNHVQGGGADHQVGLHLKGFDSMIRGNTFVQNGPRFWTGVAIGADNREPSYRAENNYVIENRFFSGSDVLMLRLWQGVDGARVENNRVCNYGTLEFIRQADPTSTIQATNNEAACSVNEPGVLFSMSFESQENPAEMTPGHTPAHLNGPVQLVPGIVGQGIEFNDPADSITIADSMSSVELTGEFSVAFWINPATLNNADVFGRRRLNRQGDVSLTLLEGGRMLFYVNALHIQPNGVLKLNRWQHVALSFNRAARQLRVYLDGRPIHDAQIPENVSLFFNTGSDINIGAGQRSSASVYFRGRIDEFKLFNTTLSATAIRTLAGY